MADPPGVTAVARFSTIELQALRAVYESSLERHPRGFPACQARPLTGSFGAASP
jgi:hypothetical protein